MSVYRWLALLAVPAAALALTTPAMASTAAPAASHAKASGTKIIVTDTPFGRSLAVGSGPYKNYILYFISSDNPPSYGCTTVVVSLPGAPPGATCTGPSNDENAEWPAITTNGNPIAGPGVSQALLGRVYRKHVGWQVTYAGYPLYLFDQGPGEVTGEGWFEPGPLLPPWHGIWWLISARGTPVPWAGTLTTTKIGGKTVLAEQIPDRGRLGQFPGVHLQRRPGVCPGPRARSIPRAVAPGLRCSPEACPALRAACPPPGSARSAPTTSPR